MAAIVELLNIWDNPVFQRFRRSQLRIKRALFWYLATLIIATFLISVTYISQTNFFGFSGEAAARNQWTPLLILQGVILLLKGTGKTSSGLIQDKIDQTLDYQRLTPVSPLRNLVGYLFGLPVLEYTMFALTLPHLAFIVIKGNIPLVTVGSVYLVFFTCAIFYHMTAIAVGLVIKRWIWGYLLSIVSVAVLNLILPTVASQLGLKFLQYLSIFPVVGQKVAPLMQAPNIQANPNFGGPAQFGPPPGPGGAFGPPGGAGGQFGSQGGPPGGFQGNDDLNAIFSLADPVPFFNWTLSPFIFTLLLQAGLIVTFAIMARRRWIKESKHSLSKPYALGLLTVFVVLVTGNLWPAVTGDRLPFSLFGNVNIDLVPDFVWVILPLIYSMFVWLLGNLLFVTVVPTHHSYIRGVRRAVKLGHKAAAPWDDDSANLPFMSLFIAVALVGYFVLHDQMAGAGLLDFLEGTGYVAWRLPLVLFLVMTYSLLLLQVLEYRGTILVVLLIWLLPVLVAIVTGAAIQDLTRFQSIVASLSPLATILATGMLPIAPESPADVPQLGAVLTGIRFGIFFLVVQTAFLSYRWFQLKKVLH